MGQPHPLSRTAYAELVKQMCLLAGAAGWAGVTHRTPRHAQVLKGLGVEHVPISTVWNKLDATAAPESVRKVRSCLGGGGAPCSEDGRAHASVPLRAWRRCCDLCVAQHGSWLQGTRRACKQLAAAGSAPATGSL